MPGGDLLRWWARPFPRVPLWRRVSIANERENMKKVSVSILAVFSITRSLFLKLAMSEEQKKSNIYKTNVRYLTYFV